MCSGFRPAAKVYPDDGTHRRGGQAGPPDGLGARVQGRVFGLMQDRVHAEGLLAVHRHHDCGREGGSLCVVLVWLRFGSVPTETPRAVEYERSSHAL